MMRPVQNDVFPQMMTFDVTTADDATASERIQMPIARLPDKNRVQVIEIVRIMVEYNLAPGGNADLRATSLAFRDFDTTEATYSSPSVFFKTKDVSRFTTSGQVYLPFTLDFDYTTGGGRGFLIATDSIFAQATAASIGSSLTARYKVWYRFVYVGLQEYIGIVQQQQAQS